MASNFTDDERKERIILVGEYFLSHPDSSTRKIAEYFSSIENGFKISNATVCQYINIYKDMVSSDKSIIIDRNVNSNRPESVESETVRNRVMFFVSLMLDHDMTIQDISECTGVSYWIVYRDLADRLSKIDIDLYNKVSILMNERKLENLKRGK